MIHSLAHFAWAIPADPSPVLAVSTARTQLQTPFLPCRLRRRGMQQRLQSGSRLSRGLRSFSARLKKMQNGGHPAWQAQHACCQCHHQSVGWRRRIWTLFNKSGVVMYVQHQVRGYAHLQLLLSAGGRRRTQRRKRTRPRFSARKEEGRSCLSSLVDMLCTPASSKAWHGEEHCFLRLADSTRLLVGSRAVSTRCNRKARDGHCAFHRIVVGTISKQLSRARL